MEHLLEEHGVKVTANRILVARALADAGRPLSLMELEAKLETIDKSAIFRTLTAFKEAHLVHVLEDAGEGVRYELETPVRTKICLNGEGKWVNPGKYTFWTAK